MDDESAERRAQKLVAVQFFVLFQYIGYESVMALVEGEPADVSRLGIALSATSVVVMPYLAIAKQRLADLDPVVGLLIASVAVKEGLEPWRGEGCACVSDPLAGFNASNADDECADACCSTTTERADA